MSKVTSAKEAVTLIKDGDTLAVSGFAGGSAYPEELSKFLELRFKDEGHPRNMTLMMASGNGNSTNDDLGLNHMAYPEMVGKLVIGHVGLAPRLAALVAENKIAAYNFPQGVVTHLYRATAAGLPGVLTHVGLQTFADPRVEGGKMNKAAEKEDLVSVVNVNGHERLFYHTFPINVGFIRATTGDEFGNLSMEREAVITETLQLAQAVKNSGGIVIAQVERLARRGTLNPKSVRVPGILVDHVVVADKENHKMNFLLEYNPGYSGELRVPASSIDPLPMSERKIIAKRCALELVPNSIINLGIGVPDGVAGIALEEGISDNIYMTIESGAIGGVPGPGLHIGSSTNADAFIAHPEIFDFYDGGGLDMAFLGLAQADETGNINVSKFGTRMVGCGGFVNITQNAKKVVFCGTFTAGKNKFGFENNAIQILQDGENVKFIKQVEQITFSGTYAKQKGQPVLYVTERAVFRLTDAGLELVEIAPGVDLEKHVLGRMDFKPIVSKDLRLMDERIFRNEPMGLKSTF